MNTNTGGADIKGQKEKMLNYMRNHRCVTRAKAWEVLHIANAPSIINRLKNEGYKIGGAMVYPEDGPSYKEYWLEAEK